MKPVDTKTLRVADGTEIVLVQGVPTLWHLPAEGQSQLDRKTLCGLAGPVFVYAPALRGRHVCGVCAKRAPKRTFVKPPPRPRLAARRVPQLTSAQVEVFYRIYIDKGVGIPAIAELVWEKLGFATATSCGNTIRREFKARGLQTRPRSESQKRGTEAVRFLGVGGFHPGEQRLTGPVLDELYAEYQAGSSVPEVAAAHAARYGYSDLVRFRSVVEYGWKRCGYMLRSNREAELLSRAKNDRKCSAATTGSGGYRPRPCTQRALADSDFCWQHDPRYERRVASTVARMQSRINRPPSLEFAEIRPYIEPLLVPRNRKERAGGALARQTGVPGSVCCRLINGKKKRLSVESANKILAPLGLTVDQIRAREDVAA